MYFVHSDLVSPNVVFTPQQTTPNILIKGGDSCDRTHLLKTLVYHWSEGCQSEDCSYGPLLKSFDLVFFLNANDLMGHSSVEDAIMEALFNEDPGFTAELLQELFEIDKVLILIDGYDEMQERNRIVEELLNGQLLQKATVVISCGDDHTDIDGHYDFMLIINRGDEEEILTSLSKTWLLTDEQLGNLKENIKQEMNQSTSSKIGCFAAHLTTVHSTNLDSLPIYEEHQLKQESSSASGEYQHLFLVNYAWHFIMEYTSGG